MLESSESLYLEKLSLILLFSLAQFKGRLMIPWMMIHSLGHQALITWLGSMLVDLSTRSICLASTHINLQSTWPPEHPYSF